MKTDDFYLHKTTQMTQFETVDRLKGKWHILLDIPTKRDYALPRLADIVQVLEKGE